MSATAQSELSPQPCDHDLGGRHDRLPNRWSLQIDGETVAQWTDIGGDVGEGVYEMFSFDHSEPVTADQIRVVFTNDQYVEGVIDRNLVVDQIEIDGVVFETEDDSTFSTGTWNPINNAAVPGKLRSEWLHSNGYFQFANQNATEIEITAQGLTGEEEMQLNVSGQRIATWTASTAEQIYTAQLDRVLDPDLDSVRVEFVNDPLRSGQWHRPKFDCP